MAGLKSGLIKSRKEFIAGWQSDLRINPTVDRLDDYRGWQAALRGAFACAGVEHELLKKPQPVAAASK
jgi:hypothetical protein